MTALEKVTKGIAEIAGRYADRRVSIFDVQVEAGDPVRLTGRVLEAGQLAELHQLGADVSGVQVMRRAENAQRAVRVNLTSLHGEPGWLAEQVSQLLYGMELEILEEKGNWGLMRQTDGYLGWAYLPYLTSTPLAAPTHLALAPISLLHPEPEAPAIVGRVLGGTYVAVQSIHNRWAQIEGPNGGWLPLNSLRALNALPQTPAERRAQIVTDAFQMVGVQYLWAVAAHTALTARAWRNWRTAGLGSPFRGMPICNMTPGNMCNTPSNQAIYCSLASKVSAAALRMWASAWADGRFCTPHAAAMACTRIISRR